MQYLIVMKADFSVEDLCSRLENTRAEKITLLGDRVMITGDGRYGDFCSILWHCQKFGDVHCEITSVTRR